MNRILIPIIIVVIMVGGYLWISSNRQEAPPVTVEVELPPQTQSPTPQPEPPPQQYPVPEPVQVEAEPVRPLPVLDDSDPVIEQEFTGLVSGDTGMSQLLMFKAFIRNFVVIIDNMTEPKIPQKYLFVKPPAGTFLVKKDETDAASIAPENHARYLPFVRLVAALNTDSMVNVYVYLYPLFQQAYAELGYPDKYFNDRLVEVIDHLLQAPELTDPVALVQPKVYYLYADPALESRSAGQKLLMRIGNENATLIKQKLREIRDRLTTLQGLPLAG